MTKIPSDFHPELTEDKIQTVAQIIYQARMACLDEHDEISGDTIVIPNSFYP